MVEWVRSVSFPREWEATNAHAFKEVDGGGANVTLKSHAYHVLTSSGTLAIAAAWPRDEYNDPSNSKITQFVTAYTQAHRTITRERVHLKVCSTFSEGPRCFTFPNVSPCLVVFPNVCRRFPILGDGILRETRGALSDETCVVHAGRRIRYRTGGVGNRTLV
jgi:hypothetical protein